MNLGQIYAKIRKGDPLSNEELSYGIKKFKALEKELGELGPEFRLTWKQIRHDLDSMEQWRAARREKE